MKLRIVVTKEKSRYWAEVMGIPGFVTARTEKEAQRRAVKAAKLYFETAAGLQPATKRGERPRVVDVRV